jgi:hypothetical protein
MRPQTIVQGCTYQSSRSPTTQYYVEKVSSAGHDPMISYVVTAGPLAGKSGEVSRSEFASRVRCVVNG